MGEPNGIAIVRPGDRLLFTVPADDDPDGACRMAEQLRARFPDNEVTVVACDGVAVIAGPDPNPFPRLRLWSLFSRKGAQR